MALVSVDDIDKRASMAEGQVHEQMRALFEQVLHRGPYFTIHHAQTEAVHQRLVRDMGAAFGGSLIFHRILEFTLNQE